MSLPISFRSTANAYEQKRSGGQKGGDGVARVGETAAFAAPAKDSNELDPNDGSASGGNNMLKKFVKATGGAQKGVEPHMTLQAVVPLRDRGSKSPRNASSRPENTF